MNSGLNRWQRRLVQASAATSLIVLLIVSVGAVDTRPGPVRVGYVSVTRILSQSSEAQASAKRLQQVRDERAKAIAEKQKQVEALRLQLAQLNGMFQGSKRAKVAQDEEKARTELQQMEQSAQAELQKMQRDAQAELQKKLGGILNDLATQRSLDLILNQDVSIVWARSGMDLTAEAVQRINEPTKSNAAK